MSSFKQLSKSDVTHIPYAANKQWNLSYASYPQNDGYVTIYKGTNLTSSFDSIMDPVTEGQYEGLVYDSINHLFYHAFSGSLLNTSSLAMSPLYVSASQQYATSSYFIYDENPKFRNYFPTGANEGIRVLAINQSIYGNKVLPYNFVLSSSAYYLTDDGNGNIYDYNTTFVGNIFYPQGLAIITNQNYQNMFPLPPLAVADIINVKASDFEKTGNILINDLARFGTLVTSSITLSGSNAQSGFIKLTGSYNTQVAMYAFFNAPSGSSGNTNITCSDYRFFQQGTYDAYYTVNSTGSFGQLTSNKALIRFNVGAPDCDFTYEVVYNPPTPTPTPTQTLTNTPTQTLTNTPTQTLTNTPTQTLTNTPTQTLTNTQTQTLTNTPTQTLTQTVTPTKTVTPTQTLTNTPTQTVTQTLTQTSTNTPTPSPTRTQTVTPTQTLTSTPPSTPTNTPPPTPTSTPTLTNTPPPTPTSTPTLTGTPPPTPTNTPTLTQTLTVTPTLTNTPTAFAIFSGTPSTNSAAGACTNDGGYGASSWTIINSRSGGGTGLCDGTPSIVNDAWFAASGVTSGDFWVASGGQVHQFTAGLLSSGPFNGHFYGIPVGSCAACPTPTPTPTLTNPVMTPTATNPVMTPTATNPVMTPTATGVPSTYTVYVYGRSTTSGTRGISYNQNGSGGGTIGNVTSTCNFIGTITGLSIGDVIQIVSDSSYNIKGQAGTTCPGGAGGYGCAYQFTVAGTSNQAITMDATLFC